MQTKVEHYPKIKCAPRNRSEKVNIEKVAGAPPKKEDSPLHLKTFLCGNKENTAKMEADITPLAETNGEQRQNPQESAQNPEQPQPRQDLAGKSVGSADDGVSGTVGQIMDYLEVRPALKDLEKLVKLIHIYICLFIFIYIIGRCRCNCRPGRGDGRGRVSGWRDAAGG